jgi:hypothetical protein
LTGGDEDDDELPAFTVQTAARPATGASAASAASAAKPRAPAGGGDDEFDF